ncbi:hypothetical protein [Exiguobacterium sp. 8A]|uniref:hypothetical protein n=1 Tax=Exiguobacterium sp. 8A TaxID=2653139 RepID=UPI001F246BB2|nr:hypothetical protein [Exiguobacterium sp. 8A]
MRQLYRALHEQAEELCRTRSDVQMMVEDAEVFQLALSTERQSVHGSIRVIQGLEDTLFMVLFSQHPGEACELVIRVHRRASRDMYNFNFRTTNAFNIGPGDLVGGRLLDVLIAKTARRLNKRVSRPRTRG